jgi:hypothetical protein
MIKDDLLLLMWQTSSAANQTYPNCSNKCQGTLPQLQHLPTHICC